MFTDKFGNPIFQEKDLIELLYQDYTSFDNLIVENTESINKFEELEGKNFKKFDSKLEEISIKDFDQVLQADWFIPSEYLKFDIKKYCLSLCNSKEEITRVLEELKILEEKNMIPVLQTLKYIVDTLKKYNILWGVGRGSSVSSYVLFLLEVHRIDSIKYNLDYREFLR